MGLVNSSVPRDQLRGEVESLARELLAKNPVVLRATKVGFKHAQAMSWDDAEDYLSRSSNSRSSSIAKTAASKV